MTRAEQGRAAGRPADLGGAVRDLVSRELQERYGVDPAAVDGDRPLAELGLTSRDAVGLAARLSELAGTGLPPTLLWEAGTLNGLVRRICPGAPSAEAEEPAQPAEIAPTADRTGRGETAVAVAVVGVGCRLPGAIGSAAEFWRLLSEGGDAVGTVPDGRWDGFAALGDPAIGEVGRHGGFLEDVKGFDAEFFGIAPGEARVMDPQQRLLLEVARESLDHAAIPAGSLAGTRTGVFVGISGNEYAHLSTRNLGAVEAWTAPGAALSIAANRLSYALDLRGPSVALDTACSSSLVAVHQAVRSLEAGECDTALAGGVNVLLSPAVTLGLQRAGALAADGRCKAFDAKADGMVRAEGCALVVLRRLADAQRAGDRILAVIRGSAVNSDGRSNGMLAPNAQAQRALLDEVYAQAGTVAPAELDYVEAHGTGTALGDPVEAGALGAALGRVRGRAPDQPLLIGSVKANLGHLEAAAGAAGLVKTVLALHHGELPPQLGFTEPSPHIDFDATALRVVTGPEPWPRYSGTATAGVSAFGFGGTNAHVALEEHQPEEHRGRATGPRGAHDAPAVLALDAPTPERLRADVAGLAAWLDSPAAGRARLADVGRTLAGRLGRGRHGLAVVARTGEEARDALAAVGAGQPHPAAVTAVRRDLATAPVPGAVWVFSGYGSQWPGMGRTLLDQEPAFAAAVNRLEPVLLRQAGLSLRAHLEPDAALEVPWVVQPVLFGLQVALAELWRAHGLRPAAVLGHSMGEVAAAVVAGAVDEETGARIIATRSRLLDGLSGGAMAVVDRSEEQVLELAASLPSLRIAVHSAPAQCVVAGAAEQVERLIAIVDGEGGLARALPVAAAAHTPQVEPLLEPFAAQLGQIGNQAPGLVLYSTVREDPRDAAALDCAYWVRNLREPVRFRQAVTAAVEDGHRVFVEVSPHPTQLYPLTETVRAAGVEDALILPTLRRDTDDAVSFRISLAALVLAGTIDPLTARRAHHPGARIIDLPSAPWHHREFWIDAAPATPTPPTTAPPKPPDAERAPASGRRPASAAERLRACVAQVMGYSPDSIDPDAPLTGLGLDSLHAMRILALIKTEFGVDLEPGTLLRQGTIAQVTALLESASPGPATSRATNPATDRAILPRDAAERLVAQVWQSVGGAAAGVGQDIGAQIRQDNLEPALVRALGAEIGRPVGSLLPDDPAGALTIAAVADRLRPLIEVPVPGPVRVLRADGGRPPLFLIHPAGGSSAVYRSLARRLGPDQPVYGLERLADLAEVGEQAAEYARLIRGLRPDGRWAIGGWSYGGLVGQETARLLARDGDVSALVLIDSVLPLPSPYPNPAEEVRQRFTAFAAYIEQAYGCELDLPYDLLVTLDDAMRIDHVIKYLHQAVDLPAAALEHQRDSYLDLRSAERHTPGPYSGRTLLYRAVDPAPHTVQDPRYQRTDEALGWDALCPDLAVRPTPGHHLSLLDPPAVDELALLLAADLCPAGREPRC
jgi:acyl transferase domain-containing protein/thioesterase domain-containing protein